MMPAVLALCGPFAAGANQQLLLVPSIVFDGEQRVVGRVVVVDDGTIAFVGGESEARQRWPQARRVELVGTTLLPGLIDAHSHLLLHPYDETPWNDQVLKESRALRVARATQQARATLFAGFTTLRDLGSEGAMYDDVGLKEAIESGVIPGPRLVVAGRAIVATGSYGPKGYSADVDLPLGAEPADGADLERVVRDQIGHGVDVVKVYADYRWGTHNEARPTFTEAELRRIVEVAGSSGRPVVAHASTAEGIRRAVVAGVSTIEHGDGATDEVLRLMVQRGVALCPTLAAGEAIARYGGWNGGPPMPRRIEEKRASFRRALELGVTICNGSDVGVFKHGDNAWEIELLVDYGMSPVQALRAATSVNARVLGLALLGSVREGAQADLVAVEGDPTVEIGALRRVRLVISRGSVVFQNDNGAN